MIMWRKICEKIFLQISFCLTGHFFSNISMLNYKGTIWCLSYFPCYIYIRKLAVLLSMNMRDSREISAQKESNIDGFHLSLTDFAIKPDWEIKNCDLGLALSTSLILTIEHHHFFTHPVEKITVASVLLIKSLIARISKNWANKIVLEIVTRK